MAPYGKWKEATEENSVFQKIIIILKTKYNVPGHQWNYSFNNIATVTYIYPTLVLT